MSDDNVKLAFITETLGKIGRAFLAKRFSEVGATSFSIENGVMTAIIDRNEISLIIKETSTMNPNLLAGVNEDDIMLAVKKMINDQINNFLI